MKKILLFVFSLLLICPVAAQEKPSKVATPMPLDASMHIRSKAGFRVEALLGGGVLIGKNRHAKADNRLTTNLSLSPQYVFRNNSHALGLLIDYKYNHHKTRKIVELEETIEPEWNPESGQMEPVKRMRPVTYDYFATNWHTVFVAPQYTWIKRPHADFSIMLDVAAGPMILVDREKSRYTFVDPEVEVKSGVGFNVGVGCRFSMGDRSSFILRLSGTGSNLTPSLYRIAEMNISYVCLSLGFSFGK